MGEPKCRASLHIEEARAVTWENFEGSESYPVWALSFTGYVQVHQRRTDILVQTHGRRQPERRRQTETERQRQRKRQGQRERETERQRERV
eukprot:2392864-Rhodomonas_salina.1